MLQTGINLSLRINGLVLALGLFFSVQAAAENASAELASQRFHYQKAKTALAKGDTEAFEQHLGELGDYPLRQYLEFAELKDRFEEFPFAAIDHFVEAYEGTFLETRLRTKLLFFLARKERWREFDKYYRDDLPSLSLQCHHLHARIRLGDPQALLEAAELWNVGKSRPDECDALFSTWAAAGQMSDTVILSRFSKAVMNGNISLARFLAKKLKSSQRRAQAELFLEVHARPQLIAKTEKFKGHDATTQLTIAHGARRWAKREPLLALQHWEHYEAQQMFPQELIRDTKLAIIKRLIRTGHTEQAQELLKFSRALREQDLVEELAREALEQMDWQRLEPLFELLDEQNRRSDRWQYWAARLQEETQSRLKGFDSPREIYAAIALNRSFYGFLAADKLKLEYSLVDSSSPVAEPLKTEIAKLGAMRRTHELWLTGNIREARAEWFHLSQQLDDEQLRAAGQIAKDWGWYNTGIQAMISGNFWDELTVRFPLAYREEIFRVANQTQIQPTLIYAIARQESAFDATARSPVGAMGLMQLMPKTAKFTAQKVGIKHARTQQLLDAEHNMRLGSQYLNYLLEKFNGNRILAAAAYNAGPHRVNRWLSEEGKERPVDIWIETIPFKETRHYVQNVLCFSVIYGYRLGMATDFLSQDEANRYL